MKVQQSYI